MSLHLLQYKHGDSDIVFDNEMKCVMGTGLLTLTFNDCMVAIPVSL